MSSHNEPHSPITSHAADPIPMRIVHLREDAKRHTQKRRKKRVVLWVVFGVLATLVIAAAVAVIPVLENTAKSEIKTRAQAKGWDVSWSELTIQYDLSLTITDLKASGPAYSAVSLKTLRADWLLRDLLDGKKAPSRIHLLGLTGDLDTKGLRNNLSASAKAQPPTSPQTATPQRSTFARLQGTHINMRDGAVRLRNLPRGLGDIELKQFALWGSPVGAHGWAANYETVCARGCGPSQKASGEIKHKDRAWNATLELAQSLPLDLPIPGRDGEEIHIELRKVAASLSDQGDINLGARDIEIPIARMGYQGSLRVREATLKTERSTLSLDQGIVLTNPVLELRKDPTSKDPSALPVHEHSETSTLSKTPPPPSYFLKHIQKVLPHARKITAHKGSVVLHDRNLRLTNIEASPDGDDAYTIRASLEHGTFSVRLAEQSPHLSLGLEHFSIQPYAQHLPFWGDRFAGQLSGQFRVDLDDPEDSTYNIDSQVQLINGSFEHEKITPTGIHNQNGKVSITGSYRLPTHPEGDLLEIKKLTLELPSRIASRSAQLHISGSFQHLLDASPIAVKTSIWLDETPCDIAVGAVPRGMIPHIWDQMKLTGRFAPRIDFSVDMTDVYGLDLNISGLPGTCKVESLGKYNPDYLNDRFKQEVREGVSRAGIFVGPASGHYTPYYQIPRYVTAAMYLTEEGNFFINKGFDPNLIQRALRLNLEKKRYVYGGSSIEQQLVKNLFMTRRKTLSRKLEEAFIVWRMENVLTKFRIIELYMNCIEFGMNLYGIRRASRYYFGKHPSQLEPLEGAFLAALKPFPVVGNVAHKAGHTPAHGWWHKRIKSVIGKLHRDGLITPKQFREAQAQNYIVYFPGHKPAQKDEKETPTSAHPTTVFRPMELAPAPPAPTRPEPKPDHTINNWNDLPKANN